MKQAAIFLTLALWSALGMAQTAPVKSLGQSLYLPIYSHIWHGDLNKLNQPEKTLVSVSVSIRNTDPQKPIRIHSAKYFDTQGTKLKDYVTSTLVIAPMGTHEIFVPRSDDTGGSGANFVIVWSAEKPSNPPVVDGFHANLPVGRAIAFTTSASVMPNE
jgi:Protein of unknown function (DUF3124)